MRALTLLWSVAILVAALLAAYVTLLVTLSSLSNNPCALGDQPCKGTLPLRIFGVVFGLFGTGAVIGCLASAVTYVYCAIRPDPLVQRRAGRLFLIGLACAAAFVLVGVLVWVTAELGFDLTTDRPE